MKEGDLRMLGASDGMAHVLVDLKFAIGRIMHHPIPARHIRRIKAREEVLRPLRELQAKYQKAFEETRAAYQRTTL